MLIKSTLLISFTTLSVINYNPTDFSKFGKFSNMPYESLYQIETGKNKNIMEYNTMTNEELIRLNNEKLSTRPE